MHSKSEGALAAFFSPRMVEDSPDAMIAVDRGGTVHIFNAAAVELFGFPKGEIIGSNVIHLYSSESEARRIGKLLYKDGSIKDEPAKIRVQGGSTKSISLSAKLYLDEQNKKIGSFSVFKEVSSIERPIEEKARAKYFKNLVLNSPDPTVVVSKEGLIEIFNNAAGELFGFSEKEVRGKKISVLYASKKESARIGRLLQDENQIRNVEAETVDRHGRRITVSLSARLLYDESGDPSGSFGVFKDLRKLREGIFRGLANTKGHDFKNQLLAAQVNVYALSLAPLSDETAQLVENLKLAVDQAADGIHNFLSVSSRDSPRKQLVSIRSLEKNINKRYALLASVENIDFEVSNSVVATSVLMDELQIFQVIANLFQNSLESINEKAAKFDGHYVGKIAVHLKSSSTSLTVVWRDDGVGISTESLPRVFDPHFTNKKTGTGIGLSVSKAIVENHGGVIAVTSREGVFTEFTFEIPLIGLAEADPLSTLPEAIS